MPAVTTSPLITIAMPFYNSAATMELTLRSLLHQSYGDFELLLCDDGSGDQSLAIARSFNDPRIVCWSDGRRLHLAARLNECIDRARGVFLARMDADDVAYPDRLRHQLFFLHAHPEVDLCAGGAMVFGRKGRPLWRFHPPEQHARIVQAPFRGFPLWHPLWMGRIEWFRRWRYDETAWLAQDQELLLRSYRRSCFANLPQILGGYRLERVSLGKLLRYKRLHMQYILNQREGRPSAWQTVELAAVSAARFAANCAAAVAGPERTMAGWGWARRFAHQAAEPPTEAEQEEWLTLWTLLSCWYGRPANEGFLPQSTRVVRSHRNRA